MNEPPANNILERLNNSTLVRFLLLFASGWATVLILDYFKTVIVIFTFAAIVAFLLSYPVRWLHRYLPHGVAVTLVFVLGMGSLAGIALAAGITIASQGQQLIESLTAFVNSLGPLGERLENFLQARNIQVDFNASQIQLRDQILASLGVGLGYSLATIQIFFENFLNFILIAVVAFFMLLDGERLWSFILKIIPERLQKRFTYLIKKNFLGFFRGQIILCLFLTTFTFIIFLILRVPFPLLLAVIAGVFDLIPGIGATLGVGIIFLIVLSQQVWLAIQVLIACIIVQQIQDNFISPRIMQDALNINPVVVFLALLVGAKVAGLLGIFIAIPITGVIVSLFEIDEMKAES
ncbi:MAG: AI-2E family transporter [Aphanothece sp. CMT-3BRIN-NPC111]|jgi:predicted PurR-regulated permease PerM|nr:AI-2E family transporter [Aphanothece sp. CMT-3BRIN-NPC111]